MAIPLYRDFINGSVPPDSHYGSILSSLNRMQWDNFMIAIGIAFEKLVLLRGLVIGSNGFSLYSIATFNDSVLPFPFSRLQYLSPTAPTALLNFVTMIR
jgi:hypothetical protein